MSTPENLLEQYKACIDDVGRIGERYESSKNFYVTILTALFAFLALAGGDGAVFKLDLKFLWLVSIVGLGVCVLWIVHTQSVTTLFRIKFRLLAQMEEQAALYPVFKTETQWLFQPDTRPAGLKDMKYVQIGRVNIWVAGLFAGLFLLLPMLKG